MRKNAGGDKKQRGLGHASEIEFVGVRKSRDGSPGGREGHGDAQSNRTEAASNLTVAQEKLDDSIQRWEEEISLQHHGFLPSHGRELAWCTGIPDLGDLRGWCVKQPDTKVTKVGA